MLGWLTDPFAGEIARRALLEVVLLAGLCGPLGVWILLGRHTYAAEAMGHGMLPGLVVAALVGAPLVGGAAAGVLATVTAVSLAGADARIGPDAGPAVAVTGLTGLGALLAVAADAPPRLDALLFGDLLGVRRGDLVAAAVALVLVGVALRLVHRRLLRDLFDGRGSRAALVLVALVGVTTAVGAPALGSLLILALLLAPAAAALQVARSVGGALAGAAALAALAGLAGLVVSHHLAVAAGASVALCALLPWSAVLVLTARRGSASMAAAR